MARMTLERIGALLKERRGERGIREVAKEITISSATLSRIERGKVPDLDTFTKICRWLKIDPGDVLGRPHSEQEKRTRSFHAPAVHFKAEKAISPRGAKALAELILSAQRMLAP